MMTADTNTTSTITLPNPWCDPASFGMRVSRWARSKEDDESNNKKDSSSNRDITLDSNRMVKVSIGFWNNVAQPRHMEMMIRLDGINEEEEEEEEEEAVLGTEALHSWLWYTDRPYRRKTKPLWVLDAYMGGDNQIALVKRVRESLVRNPKAHAPLALGQDVSRRAWSAGGNFVHKHWVEVYHMRVSTFEPLLRRFVRWGFAVGSGRQFRFHPFLFMRDDLQAMNDIPENLNFINCQASVTLLLVWWLREAAKVIHENNSNNSNNQKSQDMVDAVVQNEVQRVVQGTAPHLLIRPCQCCVLWWTPSVRKQTKACVNQFLDSEAVKNVMALSDEEVTSVIERYEQEKLQKQQQRQQEALAEANNITFTTTEDGQSD